MIGSIALATVVALATTALYVPAQVEPEHYLARLRHEYHATTEAWGGDVADRMLIQSAVLLRTAAPAGRVAMPERQAPAGPLPDALAEAQARVLESTYFRSIDNMLALAAFRLSLFLLWTLWLLPLGIASLLDSAAIRAVHSREIVPHDPERFTLFSSAAALIAAAMLVSLFAPIPITPWALPAVAATMLWLGGRSWKHYHRRA